MTGLHTAIAFLTVLPAGRSLAWEPSRAVAWYPVVALALAALAGVAAYLAAGWFPPLLAAVLIVAVLAVLTGALHLDGLADTADAVLAPVPPERRLEILADVHHGTFALVAVTLVILLKVAALASLDRDAAAAAVFLAVVAARCLLPLAMLATSPARATGLGASTRAGATPAVASLGSLTALASGGLAFGWSGMACVAGLALLTLATAWWIAARLGGLTGDSYGALVELLEAAALVTAAGLVTNGHAGPFPLDLLP